MPGIFPTEPTTVTLSGDAVLGIRVDGPEHFAAVAALPTTVRLGRKPARPGVLESRPRLEAFLDLARRAQTLPPSTNWRKAAALALARMYLNDVYGDCVWASNMHLLGVTSANESGPAGVVQATDAEVLAQYQRVCGPGDNGCVITDTLDWGVRNGWVAGGKTYKILGYASVDWTNWDLCRACCADFGGYKIGIQLPQDWLSAATWDATDSPIVGGHDVLVTDFDDTYLYLSSWGRVYRMTKAAALSRRWLQEAYVVLAPTWAADGTAPSGYDVAGLKAAMAAITGGGIPNDPTPPTPPPVPPTPPPVPPTPPTPPTPPVPPVPPTPPTPPSPVPTGNFNLKLAALCGPGHKVVSATYTITPAKTAVHVETVAAALAFARPDFAVPPAVLDWLAREEGVAAEVLLTAVPEVFAGLKTWDQVLVELENAVAAGPFRPQD